MSKTEKNDRGRVEPVRLSTAWGTKERKIRHYWHREKRMRTISDREFFERF